MQRSNQQQQACINGKGKYPSIYTTNCLLSTNWPPVYYATLIILPDMLLLDKQLHQLDWGVFFISTRITTHPHFDVFTGLAV